MYVSELKKEIILYGTLVPLLNGTEGNEGADGTTSTGTKHVIFYNCRTKYKNSTQPTSMQKVRHWTFSPDLYDNLCIIL